MMQLLSDAVAHAIAGVVRTAPLEARGNLAVLVTFEGEGCRIEVLIASECRVDPEFLADERLSWLVADEDEPDAFRVLAIGPDGTREWGRLREIPLDGGSVSLRGNGRIVGAPRRGVT